MQNPCKHRFQVSGFRFQVSGRRKIVWFFLTPET
jgi:hypothetical protein